MDRQFKFPMQRCVWKRQSNPCIFNTLRSGKNLLNLIQAFCEMHSNLSTGKWFSKSFAPTPGTCFSFCLNEQNLFRIIQLNNYNILTMLFSSKLVFNCIS